jgi:hypothetical protein
MEIPGNIRTIVEIGVGLLFLIGAIFNATYTLRNSETFFRSFADSAWFPAAAVLIRRGVVPRARLFTLALVVFQAVVALLVLTRSPLVVLGLYAGAGFALAAAFVSSVGGAVMNLLMALVQAVLAVTR